MPVSASLDQRRLIAFETGAAGQLRASGDGFMAAALLGAGLLNLLAFGRDGGGVSGARFVQLR